MRIQEGKYLIKLAETLQEKQQVFSLRYDVYQKEMHFAGHNVECGQEYDAYDEFCDHLMVYDTENERCVSTFRFLPGERITAGRAFYSEQWFDLGKLSLQRNKVLELGRACIAPDYRNTKVFKMLFAGVGAYLKLYPHDYLIGLTTVSFDSQQNIRMIKEYLIHKKVVNQSFGIKPKKDFEVNSPGQGDYTLAAVSDREVLSKMSTLMLAYHKYGAEFISEPSVDIDFNPPVVDFFTIFEAEKYPKWVS